jgi:hypothetical protein
LPDIQGLATGMDHVWNRMFDRRYFLYAIVNHKHRTIVSDQVPEDIFNYSL